MGIHRGPNTVNDNLVFGYDTGYGVADNTTATRFYPGESTENLVGNPTFIGTSGTQTQGVNPANWVFSGETGSTGFQFYNSGTSPIPLKFPNEGAVITTGSGASNRRVYFRREDLLGNTTYTISCWMYFKTAFSSSWSKFQYDSSNTSTGGGYFDDFADYASANGYGLNEWFLWKGTLTTEATTAKCYWGPVISKSANVLVGMQRMQVEKKGQVTPFVNGTRSSTQSLIDLKRTTSIDVSNVSFDSTGQPTFDGSNDQIVLDVDTLARNADTITIEGIVNATSITSGGPWAILTDHATVSDKDGFWWHYNIGGYVYFRVEDATAGERGIAFSGSVPFIANTYQHVVTVVGNNKVKVYVNGELSKSYTPDFQWSRIDSTKTAYLHIGRTYPNYYLPCEIPVFKMHNRELSASEIKHNHNAYKNRFDL